MVAAIEVVWASVKGVDGGSGMGIGIHGAEIVCGIGSGREPKGWIAVKQAEGVAGGMVWLEIVWIAVVLSGRGELSGDEEIVVGRVGGRVAQGDGCRTGTATATATAASSRVPAGARTQ